MVEIWRPIAGFELSYEVSNLGRVRTKARDFIRPTGEVYRSVGCTLMPQRVNLRGYWIVDLRDDGRHRTSVVHRLVCEAFHGPAPSDDHEANHIDGDKLNSFAENLEWVTRAENMAHAYDTGLKTPLRGTEHSTAKLDDEKVRQIRLLLSLGQSHRSIAAQFGVTHGRITRIAQGKAWSHVA